jgi:hypothetical protein
MESAHSIFEATISTIRSRSIPHPWPLPHGRWPSSAERLSPGRPPEGDEVGADPRRRLGKTALDLATAVFERAGTASAMAVRRNVVFLRDGCKDSANHCVHVRFERVASQLVNDHQGFGAGLEGEA